MAKTELREQIYHEYIHSEMSAADLAEKHGVPEGRISSWITTERWAEVRRRIKAETRKQSESIAVRKRVETLARWNEGDIRLAMAIRQQVADILQAAADAKKQDPRSKAAYIHPDNLRSLTAIIEATQRIVRTSLGVIDGNKVSGESEREDEDDVIEAIEVRVKSGRLRPLPGMAPEPGSEPEPEEV